MASIRRGMRFMAQERGEWAGIPTPLGNQRLVIEPSYKFAQVLMDVGAKTEDPNEPKRKLRNAFWSWKWRTTIWIWEEDGRITWGIAQGSNFSGHEISTLGCAAAWDMRTEMQAMETLLGLTTHTQFRQYFLTGMFIESSRKSRLKYVFRRLKPTLALHEVDDEMKILCALCLHPIGYYADSWAGAMCPTDDVLAHLMLARGDEHMFWKRSNQHPAWTQAAGV